MNVGYTRGIGRYCVVSGAVLGVLLTSGVRGVRSAPERAGQGQIQPAGSSATLLPEGQWLIIGGIRNGTPYAGGYLWNPESKLATPIAGTLLTARTEHTATLLPDGT